MTGKCLIRKLGGCNPPHGCFCRRERIEGVRYDRRYRGPRRGRLPRRLKEERERERAAAAATLIDPAPLPPSEKGALSGATPQARLIFAERASTGEAPS